MRRRFFVEKFEGGAAELRGTSAEHLTRVLRAQPGQTFELSDGKAVWLGRVERATKSAVAFSLMESLPARVPRLRTELWLSIVKFDRFEWALEKATELGVAAVQPIVAERSEKGLVAAAAKRAERWRKILVESAQQSRRLTVPDLHPAMRVGDATAQSGVAGVRLLLSEREGAPHLRGVMSGAAGAGSAQLAVGPEGGWTDRELQWMLSAGFREASLGEIILRTETAVIASLAAVNYALGGDS